MGRSTLTFDKVVRQRLTIADLQIVDFLQPFQFTVADFDAVVTENLPIMPQAVNGFHEAAATIFNRPECWNGIAAGIG